MLGSTENGQSLVSCTEGPGPSADPDLAKHLGKAWSPHDNGHYRVTVAGSRSANDWWPYRLPVRWRFILTRSVIRWVGVVVGLAADLGVVIVIFGPVTDVIARHDVGSVAGPHQAAALQSARDAARGRLLQLGAGLFAAAALIYTARNFTLSREGQVTDRYTKAIEQIGSDKPLDVRIGGIYALERVARDSARDHLTIMEVLAAFVREHSHEQWSPAADNESGGAQLVRSPRPDVQAAVTVLGRRNPRRDPRRINLPAAELTRVNLHRANLSNANLAHAKLASSNLTRADLTGAFLTGADLTGAFLMNADLTGANLMSADLTGADLTGAGLNGADLTGATWPANQAVPEGWQQDNRGRLERAYPGQRAGIKQ